MFKYLEEGDQRHQFKESLETGDIDISVFTWRVGRRLKAANQKSPINEAEVVHTINTNLIKTK